MLYEVITPKNSTKYLLSMKNTIFIIYPYYLPAQKAGGIVSSLVNLVHNLDNYHFYIYTSCYDLDGTQHTTDTNQWTDYDTRIKVYYSDNADKRSIKELCQATHPTHIYIVITSYSIHYTKLYELITPA